MAALHVGASSMEPLTLTEIEGAADRIQGSGVVRTPLVKLSLEPAEIAAAGGAEICSQ